MGIGNIISDIKGAIATATSLFGGPSSHAYPTQVGSTKIESITNQPTFKDKNWQASRGYAFQVYRVDPASGTLEPEPGWTEFRLQINPQELSQDEVFAIEVTPTLHGVLVEHQGTLLKDISISGTTGLSPNRRDGGAFADTGNPVFQVGHSGYEEFHELRSYFRVYAEAKRLDSRQKGELRMVFKNFKDNENLFVEPQKFSMKRSAARPLMYDYAISLKGIGVVTNLKAEGTEWYDKVNDVLENVQDYFDAATKIIRASFGLILRFERDIQSTLMNPLLAIQQALLAVKGGTNQTFGQAGVTRFSISNLTKSTQRIKANFADAIGRDMTAFNLASGRTSTVTAAPGRQSTYQELQLLNALGQIERGLLLLSSQSSSLFEKDIFQTNRDVAATFNGKLQLSNPASVKEITIDGRDTIQTLAARELGSPDAFKDIVLLNNLKPPYIDPAGGPGVLRPGDKILLPQAAPGGAMNVAKNKTYNITKDMKEVERNLGVDIRITDDGDLAISNTKDLDLVAGMNNMAQAITIRLLMERGSLKRHLAIGTSAQVGEKFTSKGLSALKDEIIGSLGSDTRVDSIPFVELIQEGGTTKINMVIKLKNINQPIPIPTSLN